MKHNRQVTRYREKERQIKIQQKRAKVQARRLAKKSEKQKTGGDFK